MENVEEVPKLSDISIFKIVLAGEVGVGKTSIRIRYFGDKFTIGYIPTLGVDFSVKRQLIKPKKSVEIQVWDMAGQMTFQSLRKRFFLGSSSLFLTYDITNRDSFLALENWFDDFYMSYNNRKDIPVVLIGNKIDLGNPKVSKNEMDEFWEKIKQKYPDFEGKTYSVYTSALNGENIIETFERIIHELAELYEL